MNFPAASSKDNSDALRQIGGFYPTPPTIVEMMLARLAPLAPGMRILEPSAGNGGIADQLRKHVDHVVVVEPHPTLAGLLTAKGYAPFANRFEDYEPAHLFERIAMNPPFARGLDMEHVQRAFRMLAPGGLLVALMNDGDQPGDSTSEQHAAFSHWLCAERSIARLSLERLDPALLLSPENFRPSSIPVKLLTLQSRPSR